MFRLTTVLAACALSHAASAQTIYKCSADGKVAYADRPCSNGQSVELQVPAAPAAAPAREQALRARTALQQLEKTRLTRELADERAQARAERSAASRRQKCKRLLLRRKWADEDLARSRGPRVEAARTRLRRYAEELAVECPA
jgi:hypothetical protein